MTKIPMLQYPHIIYLVIQDNSIKDGITCQDYERINSSYGKCLYQAMRQEFLEYLDCLPPWMPDNLGEVCELDKAVNIKDKEKYARLTDNLLEFTSSREMDCWDKCLKPCTSMSVVIKKTDYNSNLLGRSWLNLKASTEVTVYTEVYGYDALSLIVDLGSAMGLWLGLSALSVLDYGLEAFDYIYAKYIK